ncbi:hypothetical protein ACFB49_30740 [Sphingomonas sp. DBB INV C78]|uniref:helix-turn-helix transcriptional regulator n=1 Tax=Sphingomonas sp. DBB INV C78 TaxID=3349434 RepID=UPI0036D2A104
MVDRIAYDPLLYMQSFEPMSNKIRHIIGEFIQGGGNFPDSFNVAQHLGISPSTLSRRLRQENTSFQDLKSSCQEAAAKRFLRQGDLSMHEISQRLGFWDVRSFRRAFQNWTGVLPSTFRSQSQFPTDA